MKSATTLLGDCAIQMERNFTKYTEIIIQILVDIISSNKTP